MSGIFLIFGKNARHFSFLEFMMKKQIILLVILFLVCGTCFAKSKKAPKKMPGWIESPYKQYSSEKYFAAVGSDRNKEKAELKAVEQLSSIFGQNVNTNIESSSTMTHTELEVLSQTFQKSTLNQQILIEVDQKDLIGIEIAESFQDEEHDLWYSLALLDKEKTCTLYEELTKKNNSTIETLLNFTGKMDDSFHKLAYLYKAQNLANLNEAFFTRFYVINPEKSLEMKNKCIPATDIKLKLDKVAMKIPVFVNVENDLNNIVHSAVWEMLKSFGILSSDKKSEYSLNVKITKDFREVSNPTMFYCEFFISAEIADKSGLILIPWQEKARAGGKSEKLAEEKAYTFMSEKIKSEYRSAIENYLYGEIK